MDIILHVLELVQKYGLAFVGALTVVMFVHEMGHYLIARRCGVRVEVFSIGFGRELFRWNDRSGTRWRVSLLPLGGYVKMFGDADAASMKSVEGDEASDDTGNWAHGHVRSLSDEEKAVSFHHKRLGQKAWIVAGGPLANFVLAVVVLMGLFTFYGQPTTAPVIGDVVENTAAEEAGLQAGDRFLEINGTGVDRFEQVQRIVEIGHGAPMEILIERDGEQFLINVTPRITDIVDSFGNPAQVGRLGIRSSGARELVRHDPFTAMWLAAEETVSLATATFQYLGQVITLERSADSISGPLGIAHIAGEVFSISPESFIFFIAVLSINLGLLNLFPIPMLDGGHLLFYAIEAVRGRPLGERAQEFGFRIGLALVLTLLVFATWNDLTRLNVFDF